MADTGYESKFVERFGQVILSAGIVAVPFALFKYQKRLQLKPEEIWLIGYILAHKWDGRNPYPSLRKMNRLTGVNRGRILKIVSGLREKGLLQVKQNYRTDGGNDRLEFDFAALFRRLEEFINQEEDNPGTDFVPPRYENRTGPGMDGCTTPGMDGCTTKEDVFNKDELKATTPYGEFASILSNVKGYSCDEEKELALWRQLNELFPTVDIVGETKKWAVWVLDKPLKKNSRPRSQLRNWLEKSQTLNKEGGFKNNARIKRVARPSVDFSDYQ